MDSVSGKGPSAIDYAIENTKNDPEGFYGPWWDSVIIGSQSSCSILTLFSVLHNIGS